MYNDKAESLEAAVQRLYRDHTFTRPLPPPPTKRCSRCDQEMLSSAFAANAATNDGLQDWCKQCQSEHQNGGPGTTARYVGTVLSKERADQQVQLGAMGLGACETCGTTYALTLFPPDARTRTGRATTCTHCKRAAEVERILTAELDRMRAAGEIS